MQPIVFNYFDIEQLTTRQLHQIYKMRQEVFVVEQECAYQDCDDTDLVAIHVMGFYDNQISSYCRIYSEENSIHIGRVLVSRPFRKMGFAQKMMTEVLEFVDTQYLNHNVVTLSAQLYLIPFYSALGFLSVGDPFVEDGIPHQNMEQMLVRNS